MYKLSLDRIVRVVKYKHLSSDIKNINFDLSIHNRDIESEIRYKVDEETNCICLSRVKSEIVNVFEFNLQMMNVILQRDILLQLEMKRYFEYDYKSVSHDFYYTLVYNIENISGIGAIEIINNEEVNEDFTKEYKNVFSHRHGIIMNEKKYRKIFNVYPHDRYIIDDESLKDNFKYDDEWLYIHFEDFILLCSLINSKLLHHNVKSGCYIDDLKETNFLPYIRGFIDPHLKYKLNSDKGVPLILDRYVKIGSTVIKGDNNYILSAPNINTRKEVRYTVRSWRRQIYLPVTKFLDSAFNLLDKTIIGKVEEVKDIVYSDIISVENNEVRNFKFNIDNDKDMYEYDLYSFVCKSRRLYYRLRKLYNKCVEYSRDNNIPYSLMYKDDIRGDYYDSTIRYNFSRILYEYMTRIGTFLKVIDSLNIQTLIIDNEVAGINKFNVSNMINVKSPLKGEIDLFNTEPLYDDASYNNKIANQLWEIDHGYKYAYYHIGERRKYKPEFDFKEPRGLFSLKNNLKYDFKNCIYSSCNKITIQYKIS